ncbi:MAG: hypothetical protein KF812_01230 [Fimbriimonadaceae bacterium]|nr:hypothetical protein [Fimbriimonadaceae bacterium]
MKRLLLFLVCFVVPGCKSAAPADPFILEGDVSRQDPLVLGSAAQSITGNLDPTIITYDLSQPDNPILSPTSVTEFGNVQNVRINFRAMVGVLHTSKGEISFTLDPKDKMSFARFVFRKKRHLYEEDEATQLSTPAIHKIQDNSLSPQDFWKTDIEIDGPVEDRAVLVRHLFYLRVFGPQRGGFVPGVFSTGSLKYKDHIFWDHDVWIFPALMFLDPEAAKSIPNLRLAQASQAAANARASSDAGMSFPWETDASGTELTQSKNVDQIHVGAAVSQGLQWALWLGLSDNDSVLAVQKGIAEFFKRRLIANRGTLTFNGIYGPDEFHRVNGDLYTNVAAHLAITASDPSFRLQPFIPRDSDGNLLAFESDPLLNYQQANAILTAWPLQRPEFEAVAVPMVRRFGPHVTKNGPAMTKSVEALLLARFGDADEAYEKWRESFETYEKGPLKLFCENPQSTDGPFLTGIAGCLNAVIYGFAGVRLDKEPWPDAVWKKQLKSGAWVSIRPNLPRAWKRITLTRIWLDGVAYRVEIVGRSVTVTAL